MNSAARGRPGRAAAVAALSALGLAAAAALAVGAGAGMSSPAMAMGGPAHGAGAAAVAGSIGPLSTGGSADTTTTSTGVRTHGSIKTTPDTIGWLLRCSFSHSAKDDPIVKPGMPGMSHRHDFYGNVSTSADSTVSTMLSSGTTCGTVADTAGYWTPSVYSGGTLVDPDLTSQQIYYRSGYAKGVVVQAMPTDLRVVVGSAMATTVAGNPALVAGAAGTGGIYWECDGSDRHATLPPSCSGGVVLENIIFPSCWDGVLTHGVGGANDDSHLSYMRKNGTCPGGFTRGAAPYQPEGEVRRGSGRKQGDPGQRRRGECACRLLEHLAAGGHPLSGDPVPGRQHLLRHQSHRAHGFLASDRSFTP